MLEDKSRSNAQFSISPFQSTVYLLVPVLNTNLFEMLIPKHLSLRDHIEMPLTHGRILFDLLHILDQLIQRHLH